MDAEFWDERYGGSEKLFSGNPNGVLVTEVADLPPGHALDVGCGEGGDALWLARRGWRVTAVDISRVALDRAAAAGAEMADRIAWARADLAITPPPAGSFDLVSLLVAGHDLADLPPGHESDFDPAGFYQPAEIGALLGDGWTVLVDETRLRTAPAPEGTRHARDTVLRARRD
jgi:SAM-dependent methyltransferase